MSMAVATASIPFQVLEPFIPNKHADVIIRSGDGHDFHTAKVLLSLCSPVFQDMFSLPQQPETSSDDAEHRLPIVKIPESGAVTDVLLRCIYPVDPPALINDQLVSDSISAAHKYEMNRVIDVCKRAIRELYSSDDESILRAFVLSCAHRLEDETQLAAFKSLRLPLSKLSFLNIFDTLPGRAVVRLMEYHNRIEERIIGLFSGNTTLAQTIANTIRCRHCCEGSGETVNIPEWWEQTCLSMKDIIYTGGPLPVAMFSLQSSRNGFPFGCNMCQPSLMGVGFAGLSQTIKDEMDKAAYEVEFELPWDA